MTDKDKHIYQKFIKNISFVINEAYNKKNRLKIKKFYGFFVLNVHMTLIETQIKLLSTLQQKY